MPELPEVETIARAIKPEIVGKIIVSANLLWAGSLAVPSAKKFIAQVAGQKINRVSRRAKYLILHLQDYDLLLHLRMSGDILLREGRSAPEKHDRLVLNLRTKNGRLSQLAFRDPRKFGRIWLTENPQTFLGKLGPEPLEKAFTPQWLFENLQKKKRLLKPLLLDQTFIAGLGNIYTDESLHIAKLHPLSHANALSPDQARNLHKAIQSVLREGIRRNGASIDWVYRGGDFQNHFRVYGRNGSPCPVCHAVIQKMTVGQRGTHVCPACQVLERK